MSTYCIVEVSQVNVGRRCTRPDQWQIIRSQPNEAEIRGVESLEDDFQAKLRLAGAGRG